MRKIVAIIAMLLFVSLYNHAIYVKEQHIATGTVVNLELAPVDPRSLMQGDFMILNYQLTNDIRSAIRRGNSDEEIQNSTWLEPETAFVVVNIDDQNRASFVRIDDGQAIESSQMNLQFRVRQNRIKFATNAFFFEEGTGQKYETARYGQFRVNANGEVLLTALLDDKMQVLGYQDI